MRRAGSAAEASRDKGLEAAEEVGGGGGAEEGEGRGEGRASPRQGAPNRPRPCTPTPHTSIQLRL